jgi:hypothetical protein
MGEITQRLYEQVTRHCASAEPQTKSIESVKAVNPAIAQVRRQTAGLMKKKSYIPSNATDLPPLGSANDPLQHALLTSECLGGM